MAKLFVNMTYLSASKSWTCKMCYMKSSNGWTLMVLYNFNGWTQIVKLSVIRQISQPYFKQFRKTYNMYWIEQSHNLCVSGDQTCFVKTVQIVNVKWSWSKSTLQSFYRNQPIINCVLCPELNFPTQIQMAK